MNDPVHRDLERIRELLALGRDVDGELDRTFQRLEHHLAGHCRHNRPAHITLTASPSPGGPPMSSYAQGAPVYLTAAVTNAEQAPISDAVSWSASAGTVTADPANPLWATLVNAPLGDVTVTATTSNGIQASDTVTIVDNTPAAITLTDSGTPNTPAA